MRCFIAVLAIAFLASAASAITPEGYSEYDKKIKTYAEEERYYRNNADYCDKKLDDTDWWNIFGKARWGLEKWSNTSKANEANRNEEFYQKQRDEELAAEKRRREAEAERYREGQQDRREIIRNQNEKIKDLREEENFYQKNSDFCEDKRKDTSWWNVPGKLRWWLEETSNQNKADDARDQRRIYERERDWQKDQAQEAKDDYEFRRRLNELKDKALTGSERDRNYYDMMEKAYDYYRLKEKYEETSTWSPFLGVIPKIVNKARLDHALKEAQEAQAKVYPELYGKPGATTKINDLNSKLQNKGIKR